jgi:hypothetical protein
VAVTAKKSRQIRGERTFGAASPKKYQTLRGRWLLTSESALFAASGTAQAATAWAWPDSDPLGVTMHVQSTGAWGWCEYTAVPVGGGLKPLPAYKVPFHLNNGQESTMWFPGIPTGTTRNVTITCEHGGLNNSQVLY